MPPFPPSISGSAPLAEIAAGLFGLGGLGRGEPAANGGGGGGGGGAAGIGAGNGNGRGADPGRAPAPSPAPASSSAASSRGASHRAQPIEAAPRKPAQKYLNHCKSLYSCIYCRTHLANHDELVSRSFQGNQGRAYLFNSVVNVSCGPAVQRQLNTGSHAVADIFCSNCKTTLGWKYEKAFVETQKYKEGKFIIELAHVVRENRHLELDKGELLFQKCLAKQQHQQLQASHYNNNNNNNRTAPNSPDYLLRSAGGSAYSSVSPSSPHWSSPPTSDTGSGTNDWRTSNHERHSTASRLLAHTARSLEGRGYYDSSNRYDQTVGANNDDEQELMFPFYDDICADRLSSCPGVATCLSSSLKSRVRRSFYLDSTPYDWKHCTVGSASSCSSSSPASSSSSSSSSPASSSSPTSAPSQPGPALSPLSCAKIATPVTTASSSPSSSSVEPVAGCSGTNSRRAASGANDTASAVTRDQDRDQDVETQFEFETDSAPPTSAVASANKSCDSEVSPSLQQDNQPKTSVSTSENEPSTSTSPSSSQVQPQPSTSSGFSSKTRTTAAVVAPGELPETDDDGSQATASSSSEAAETKSSLDDEEEFYDCCAEQETSSSVSSSSS